MIDHGRFRDLAAVALDFDLDPDEGADLDRHLAECAACRRYVESLTADDAAVRSLPAVDAPQRVAAAVRARRGRRSSRPWLAPAAAVIVVALTVTPLLVASLLFRGFSGGGGIGAAPAASPGSEPSVAASGAPASHGPVESSGPTPGLSWERVELAGLAGNVRLVAVDVMADTLVAVGDDCAGAPADRCSAVVVTSTDGLTWSRVPDSPSLAVAARDDGIPAGMRDIVAAGPGFVAVGSTGSREGAAAAVWTSPDGRRWARAGAAAALDGGAMTSVATTPDGLIVAAGTVVDGPNASAAVWVSADGLTWDRIANDPIFSVGPAGASEPVGIADIAWAGDRLVAVGVSCVPGGSQCEGVSWVSSDGRAWTEGGPFGVGLPEAVATADGVLVAVGRDPGRPSRPAAWRSADGATWEAGTVEPYADGVSLIAVAGSGGRLLAGGTPLAGQPGLWSSGDGLDWGLDRDAAFDRSTVLGIHSADVALAVGRSDDGDAVLWLGRPATGGSP